MNTLADRLKEAMSEMPEVKAVDIARACGIRSASIVDWQTGRTKKLEGSNLLATAELLRVNPWWLATGRGHMRAPYTLDPGRGVVSGAPSDVSLGWPFSANVQDYEKLTEAQRSVLDSIVSAFLSSSLSDLSVLRSPTADGSVRATLRRARKVAT